MPLCCGGAAPQKGAVHIVSGPAAMMEGQQAAKGPQGVLQLSEASRYLPGSTVPRPDHLLAADAEHPDSAVRLAQALAASYRVAEGGQNVLLKATDLVEVDSDSDSDSSDSSDSEGGEENAGNVNDGEVQGSNLARDGRWMAHLKKKGWRTRGRRAGQWQQWCKRRKGKRAVCRFFKYRCNKRKKECRLVQRNLIRQPRWVWANVSTKVVKKFRAVRGSNLAADPEDTEEAADPQEDDQADDTDGTNLASHIEQHLSGSDLALVTSPPTDVRTIAIVPTLADLMAATRAHAGPAAHPHLMADHVEQSLGEFMTFLAPVAGAQRGSSQLALKDLSRAQDLAAKSVSGDADALARVKGAFDEATEHFFGVGASRPAAVHVAGDHQCDYQVPTYAAALALASKKH